MTNPKITTRETFEDVRKDFPHLQKQSKGTAAERFAKKHKRGRKK